MIYFIIAALIMMLDQIAKYFVTLHLTPGVNVPLIPGVIHLTYVENTGAAFSFLRGIPWLLAGVTGLVILLLIIGMIKYRDKIDPIGKLALAAILGGAVSHLIDRVVLGYVVDFLEFEFIRGFAIMDIADWFITVGGVVFCLYYLIHSSKHDGLREEFVFGKKKTVPEGEPEKKEDGHTDGINPEDDRGTDQA